MSVTKLQRLCAGCVTAAAVAAPATAPAATFTVAPTGNDRAAGTASRPFRTPARAQAAARATRGPDTIVLRGGVYRLARPLVLDARDSEVTWEAAPGETPVLSGGVPVTGWTQLPNGQWRARSPVADTRQLYVDGVRAPRASGAPPPLRRTATGFETTDGSTPQWRDPQDVELVFHSTWREYRGRVASVSGTQITMQQPFFANAQIDYWATLTTPVRVENAYELLDTPGEWYLDRPARTLYYLPRAGETPVTTQIVVPRLAQLVVGRGTPDRPLHDVAFRGITFADTTWLGPGSTGDGFVPYQANFFLVGAGTKDFDAADGRLVKSPAALDLHGAQHVDVAGDRFVRLGGAGINLARGSTDDTVEGCELTDVSGNGIQLGDVFDFAPPDPRLTVQRIVVRDNWVHDVAVEYQGGVGIWAGYVAQTTIAHNEVDDLPYTGISVGWGWARHTGTPARDNVVEANDVENVMQVLQDGGGIYLLGDDPGSVVRGNVVAHVPGRGGAIYLDDGSRDSLVEDNVAWDTHQWPFMLKGTNLVARDNWWDFDSWWGYYRFSGTTTDNHVVASLAQAPADIVGGAGLEPAYRSMLRGA